MRAVSTPEPRDERRHERCADAHRREPEHLDDTEDACEDVVRDGALNQREPGDVDEGASDPHDCERDHGDDDFLPEADRDQREAR